MLYHQEKKSLKKFFAIYYGQVRNLSGEWIQAKPVPGTFVCNIGDMLEVSLLQNMKHAWSCSNFCVGKKMLITDYRTYLVLGLV